MGESEVTAGLRAAGEAEAGVLVKTGTEERTPEAMAMVTVGKPVHGELRETKEQRRDSCLAAKDTFFLPSIFSKG